MHNILKMYTFYILLHEIFDFFIALLCVKSVKRHENCVYNKHAIELQFETNYVEQYANKIMF